MNVNKLSVLSGLPLVAGDGKRVVNGGVYCCDLLSLVMGKAPTGSAWVTVMNNQNSVIAAMMADTACVVFAEGIAPDETVLRRAAEEGINVLVSEQPVYETAHALDTILQAPVAD